MLRASLNQHKVFRNIRKTWNHTHHFRPELRINSVSAVLVQIFSIIQTGPSSLTSSITRFGAKDLGLLLRFCSMSHKLEPKAAFSLMQNKQEHLYHRDAWSGIKYHFLITPLYPNLTHHHRPKISHCCFEWNHSKCLLKCVLRLGYSWEGGQNKKRIIIIMHWC